MVQKFEDSEVVSDLQNAFAKSPEIPNGMKLLESSCWLSAWHKVVDLVKIVSGEEMEVLLKVVSYDRTDRIEYDMDVTLGPHVI